MKRWLASLFISGYLATLGYGIACHTLSYGVSQHPIMYFIVWDMFCGWSAYAGNVHVVGEGESGRMYELAPGPWGDFVPYGSMGRQHYDSFYNHLGTIAVNTLNHTRHEPITRMFVIEEQWAKKFDLPDHIWNSRYDEPKDKQKYCHVRLELNGDGRIVRSYAGWIDTLVLSMLADNPRLRAESRTAESFFMVDRQGSNIYGGGANASFAPVGSPMGN